MIDTTPISCKLLGDLFGIDGKQLQVQYFVHLSDFKTWDQASHAKKWLIFPDNIGSQLSMVETSLSNGELYTVLTNKSAKGKKGAIVAIVEGTTSKTVIEVIKKIPEDLRAQVEEITVDLAPTMHLIAKRSI